MRVDAEGVFPSDAIGVGYFVVLGSVIAVLLILIFAISTITHQSAKAGSGRASSPETAATAADVPR